MNALLALAAAAALGQPPAPALHAADPVAALGPVKAGPPVTHTFDLAHRGPAGVLTVTGVEAGCGCLRQHLSTGTLRPGDAAKLTLEINTLTQPDGPNRWWVRVRYQVAAPPVPGQPDPPPQTGALELYVTAILAREVTVEPPQLALSGGGAITHALKVTDRRGKLAVVRAVASAPYLAAEVGPAAGGVQQVVLKLAADAPAGLRDESVTLVTNDPEYPELRVPVRVNRRPAGGAVAYPERATVRPTPGQPEASVLVQVRRPDGGPVQVEKVESDHPALTAKWSPGAGPVATVRLILNTATAGGAAGGTEVRVRLNDPAGQVLVVPVGW